MRRGGLQFLVALILTGALFPFYWAVNGALQPEDRIIGSPADYFPIPGSLDSFAKVLRDDLFAASLLNSAAVAGGTTAMALTIGALAAFALGRSRMPGRKFMLMVILSMTMFPQISVLGAMYTIISEMGLYNRLPGLILSYMLFTLPLTVWVMTNFFRAVPKELEEAAYVDGANPLQSFLRILLPLSLPGLVTAGLLAFIAAWNEYLFALSFTSTARAKTVPVVIAGFAGSDYYVTPWGQIMAASVVVTVPLIVLALVFQKKIMSGMTAGAVKG